MASFFISPTKLTDCSMPLVANFDSQLSNDGEAVVSATISVAVFFGVDASPTDILDGSPVQDGNVVTQNIIDGVAGVMYLVGFNAVTSRGNSIVMYTYLGVIDSNAFQ